MKFWHVLATAAFLATFTKAIIKLVGPDESTEDITKPIKNEYEISWYRFKNYFDDGNNQWKVFDIARKYYTNKETNITYQNFIQAGKEYVIEDLVSKRHSFHSTGTLLGKVHMSLVFYMNEKKNETFTLEEFFRHTVQGRFKQFMRVGVEFNDQPWEIQQKLVHDLEVKKRKDMFSHASPHEDHEETYIYGYKSHNRDIETMRREEIGRRFRSQYAGIEWMEDGRKVTDIDYEEEIPAKERTLHKYAQTRENSTKEIVDELLGLELDTDL
jgi:hypothetical protein